ncbi:MAG: hypothetical protein H7Y13_10725 [Sphingobacteriaceae bacterium]|nr:hypothetical protein [Sphingobacteriaceae bacterium]
MKKLLFTICFAASIALASCSGPREESYDQDSIDAARSADSMLQNELNADTTMNTDSTTDTMSTDSMQDKSRKP